MKLRVLIISVLFSTISLVNLNAQEAMRTIRRNASKWNIDPHKIGVIDMVLPATRIHNQPGRIYV
jgi:hypothetical protein